VSASFALLLRPATEPGSPDTTILPSRPGQRFPLLRWIRQPVPRPPGARVEISSNAVWIVGLEDARLRARLRPPLKLHRRVCRMQLSRSLNETRGKEKELKRTGAQLVLDIELGRAQPFPATHRAPYRQDWSTISATKQRYRKLSPPNEKQVVEQRRGTNSLTTARWVWWGHHEPNRV
jgi:hypothetical protein